MGTCVEPSVLEDLASSLDNRHTIYHTCHCTDMEAFGQLHSLMGEAVRYIGTGDEIVL